MGYSVPKRNRGGYGVRPPGTNARLAPDQGTRGWTPKGWTRVPARKKTPESKHGSGVLIKIPCSILIGWGLPNIT